MNKRLKEISLFATLILVMFLSACNSTNNTVGVNISPDATQTSNNSPKHTPTNGYDNIGFNHNDGSNSSTVSKDSIENNEKKPTNSTGSKNNTDQSRNDPVKYKHYTNGRFGYSIEYPNNFSIKVDPVNGDGLGLIAPDGNTELSIWGGYNVLNDTPKSYMNMILKEHNSVTYKKNGDNWIVASWSEGDKIVYTKVMIDSDLEYGFQLTYPSSQKEHYDLIISHLINTLKKL